MIEISDSGNIREYVLEALSNVKLWNTDLSKLNGFSESVIFNVELIKNDGIIPAMASILEKAKSSSAFINEIK